KFYYLWTFSTLMWVFQGKAIVPDERLPMTGVSPDALFSKSRRSSNNAELRDNWHQKKCQTIGRGGRRLGRWGRGKEISNYRGDRGDRRPPGIGYGSISP